MSIILGVDPGTRVTGFGVLKVEGDRIRALSYGVIQLAASEALSHRLAELSENLEKLILKYQPQIVTVEKIFLGKNADSAFKLGHARGVIMSESAQKGAEVFEYATRVIKQSLTGNGNAGKEEVNRMVCLHLALSAIEKMDASDALAVALHHAFLMRVNVLLRPQNTEGGVNL